MSEFRPMSELKSPGRLVELKTRKGRVVRGWLFIGDCGVAMGPTYWTNGIIGLEKITPVGWREMERQP